jgi:hypothetical protein
MPEADRVAISATRKLTHYPAATLLSLMGLYPVGPQQDPDVRAAGGSRTGQPERRKGLPRGTSQYQGLRTSTSMAVIRHLPHPDLSGSVRLDGRLRRPMRMTVGCLLGGSVRCILIGFGFPN